MRKVEKYSDDWILRLASSVGEININPLKCRRPKWWSRLFGLSKKGLLRKERVSCGEFIFTLTDEGKAFMKGDK